MPSPMTLSNMLLCGMRFNMILDRLAGWFSNIRRIVVVKGVPDTGGGVRVSCKCGPLPVYASWDAATGTVTLTSEADRVLVNEDASWMFARLMNLEGVNAQAFDTSCVKNMSWMFWNCYDDAFDPDLSGWDVSSVADMSHIFYGCLGASFNPDLSRWDVSNVTNMSHMFDSCSGGTFNPDLSSWDVSNVTNMSYMFDSCRGAAFNPDLSSWNVSSVTDMDWMFSGCSGASFNPDVSKWNVYPELLAEAGLR